jgi:hypothetical protein
MTTFNLSQENNHTSSSRGKKDLHSTELYIAETKIDEYVSATKF